MAQLKAPDKRSRKKKQEQFLEKLESLGNITAACRKIKVSRRTIYNWLDTDETFKVAYDKSVKIAIDLLEDEAKRRAFTGYLEPVYQGGKKVGTVRKFSDTLLTFLLKSLKKEDYGTVIRNEVSAPGGGPIETKATVISNVDYTKLPSEALEAIIAARIKVQD